MEIYTSYFGNIKELKKAGIIPVSIARWLPKWYNGIALKNVAPTPSMLKDDITRDEYIARYKAMIKNVNAKEFIETLSYFTKGQPCALLCYEKPNEFCHRHLLAEYLNKELGLNIQEFNLNTGKEIPKAEPQELSLF